MDIVVDTNIFLAVALQEAERARVVELTVNAAVLAPEFLPYDRQRFVGYGQASEAHRIAGPES